MFFQPPPGQLSNIGRNFFTLPHTFNISMAIAKKFRVTEQQNFELRLDVQNLTNAVNYDVPLSTDITDGAFDKMLGQTLTGYPGYSGARKMQLSGRYTF